MLRLTFSQEDIEQEALLLKSRGLAHKDFCRILAISGNTLRQYLRLYEPGGIEALNQFNYQRPKSELAEYADVVEERLLERPVATVAQAAALIEELTGIRRRPTQVRMFLKQFGFRRLKAGCLPAKADPIAQADFQKT